MKRVGGAFIVIVIILWILKDGGVVKSKPAKQKYSPEPIQKEKVKMDSIFDMQKYILPPVEVDNSDVMMSYLGNQTQRAELGHSTWHFLHTLAARYPIEPTEKEQKSVTDFIHLFSRLYPCGNCAGHFQLLLKEDPPTVSSRDDLVMWFCRNHNKVNVRLKKPMFDCSEIYERWQCGCIEK